jgi:hypothetical protein
MIETITGIALVSIDLSNIGTIITILLTTIPVIIGITVLLVEDAFVPVQAPVPGRKCPACLEERGQTV